MVDGIVLKEKLWLCGCKQSGNWPRRRLIYYLNAFSLFVFKNRECWFFMGTRN